MGCVQDTVGAQDLRCCQGEGAKGWEDQSWSVPREGVHRGFPLCGEGGRGGGLEGERHVEMEETVAVWSLGHRPGRAAPCPSHLRPKRRAQTCRVHAENSSSSVSRR